MEIKLRPYSLAMTPARRVLPVPGAPYNSRPDRMRRGQLLKSFGYYNKQHTKVNFNFNFLKKKETTKNKKTSIKY